MKCYINVPLYLWGSGHITLYRLIYVSQNCDLLTVSLILSCQVLRWKYSSFTDAMPKIQTRLLITSYRLNKNTLKNIACGQNWVYHTKAIFFV